MALAGTREGERFMGVCGGPADAMVHLAWMDQMRDGGFRLRNDWSGREGGPEFFNAYFFLAGSAARMLGLPSVVADHVARNVVAIVLLWLLAALFRRHAPPGLAGPAGFLLAACGSGWSWMLPAFVRAWLWEHSRGTFVAMDRVMADSTSVFPSLSLRPLSAAAMACLVGALLLVSGGVARRSSGRFLAAGIVAAFLALSHPYDAATLGLACSLWAWHARGDPAARNAWRRGLPLLAAPTAAALLFEARQLHDSRLLAQAFATWHVSPSPASLLLGFGAALPLAAAGWWRARTAIAVRDGHLWAFPAAALFLFFVPYPYQARAVIGLWPFLVLWSVRCAASSLLPALRARCGGRCAAAVLAALAALSLGSAASSLSLCRDWLSHDHRSYYARADEDAALRYLASLPPRTEVIFAEPRVSLWIPVHGRQLAAQAQFLVTRDWDERQADWDSLRTGRFAPREQVSRLSRLGITLVWWDHAAGPTPAALLLCAREFAAGGVELRRIPTGPRLS